MAAVTASGVVLFATPTLKIFLENSFSAQNFSGNQTIAGKSVLDWFALLDDNDILSSVKQWQFHPDPILAYLSKSLIHRKLFSVVLESKPVSKKWKAHMIRRITEEIICDPEMAEYLLMTGEITNSAYNRHNENIKILFKDGKVRDLGKASDINLLAFTKTVRKFFACYPKELDIN